MANRNKERLTTAPISQYCEDLLEVSAQIHKRSKALQASILLTEAILNHQEEIREQVSYLANEAGISFHEMWEQLKKGE